MNICVIQAYNDYYEELAKVSTPPVAEYCKRYHITHDIVKLDETFEGRPVSWGKIKLILERFNKGYSHCLWIDCDATIINKYFDLFGLFGLRLHRDIFIAKDVNGINCGVMAFKKSDRVIKILDKVWSMTEYIDHYWWEQAALMKLYEENFEGINEITEFMPQKVFNAYEYKMYGREYTRGQICEDTFIAHFPALPRAERIELINKYTKAIC